MIGGRPADAHHDFSIFTSEYRDVGLRGCFKSVVDGSMIDDASHQQKQPALIRSVRCIFIGDATAPPSGAGETSRASNCPKPPCTDSARLRCRNLAQGEQRPKVVWLPDSRGKPGCKGADGQKGLARCKTRCTDYLDYMRRQSAFPLC